MRGMDERAELIGRIYEAALDRQIWPVVADRLADALLATVGQFGSYDARTHETPMTGCTGTR